MPQKAFGINGKYYDVCIRDLTRGFQILDNEENAGRLISGEMVRDIIGTYYNFTLKIEPRNGKVVDYNALYWELSSPEESVVLDIVLGSFHLTFDAYVTNGKDSFRYTPDGKEVWAGLTCNFIAMAPQRRPA